jgi:hypothetical protein
MCLRVIAYATADGANPSFLGAWTITDAAVAPWVQPWVQPWVDPARKQAAARRAELLGQKLVFETEAVAGPSPFACQSPRYRFRDFTAATIFGGAFADMRAKGYSADAEQIAAALGFVGPSIKTLETACHVDLYFVDAATAQVAFDDTIYTLKKR